MWTLSLQPTMCSTSTCDLEDIPLDDDDPNSIEFKILAFYTKHHVFKSAPAVFSPKLPRTRSLSQKGLGSWGTDSWTQVPWPCRNSPSSEKPINLGKKKSSWRTLFGVTEKEESPHSSPKFCFQGPVAVESQGGIHGQQWSRSLSRVDQHLENRGRLQEPFLSLTQIVPLCMCTTTHLFHLGETGLGALPPQLASWLVFKNNCPTLLKTAQKGRWQ